ncbi:MAG TPA: peptide ABC transporter substrate-binding protein [Xanthomonadaceae bacterium]|nr:peptide ABC transporter substrate-binding protein [Xanthomonadaceae bacterium]
MLRLAVILFLAVLLLDGIAQARVLERGNGPEPQTLDAHLAQDLASMHILRDLYEGLVAEDAAGRIVPGVAERWSSSADGRLWTFHLRDDARDCAGRVVDAGRFHAAFTRAQDPATGAPLAAALAAIDRVEAVDARTLRIVLSEPVPLLPRLVLPIAYPLDIEAALQLGERHVRAGHLVGNGAYCLVEAVPQSHVLVEKNPHYHGAEQVAIERVRFHATEDAVTEMRRFQAGELHLTETVPQQPLEHLRRRHGDSFRLHDTLGVFYLGYNHTRPPFAGSVALREALSAAIDRDLLTAKITAMGERPAYALVPPGVGDHTPQTLDWANWPREERVLLAQRRYSEAGYSRQRPLDIELRYNTSLVHRRTALAVAAMWREVLGVNTRLINEEWRVFVMTRRQRVITQVFRGGWFADVDDALDFLGRYAGEQPLNTIGYADAEYDRLIAAASGAYGPARRALLEQAERRLMDAHALIPLYVYTSKRLVHGDLGGFEDNVLDRHPSRFLYWRGGVHE